METLSGSALDPFKVPPLTVCWWCGNADPLTSEHKFKRADLARMWDPNDGLLWGSDQETQIVRSARKSKQVRFSPSLCAPCNNRRSQPFDRAYQRFSDYVWERPSLWRSRWLNMQAVFGESWETDVGNLARYFVKHMGCRMAHERYPVPTSLAEFLDGAATARDVQMVLFKSRPHRDLLRMGIRDGLDTRGLHLSPALGAVSRSRQELSMYSSGLVVNFVGVMYRWEAGNDEVDPFYKYRRAKLHNREKLPEA